MATSPTGKQRFSNTLDAWINNLASTGRGRKQAFSVLVDSMVAIAALWLAYTLRHGEPFSDFRSTWYLFVLLPIITVVVFASLGIYRWVIRSTNQRLFRQIIKGSLVSALAVILLAYLVPPDRITPRSLFAIFGMLLLLGTCGARFVWREIFDSGKRGKPVAIYGAGVAGRQLANMLANGQEYRPVVFLDDNPRLHDSMVAGLPVDNPTGQGIEARIKRRDINHIILAMPSLSSAEYQRKLHRFEKAGFTVRTIPTVSELMSGTASPDQIRDISIKDILGRTEVPPNAELLGLCVTGKVVLVTGGGGSIGSELCRQILALSPRRLIVLDNAEANLYHITEELNKLTKDRDLRPGGFKPVLGSVTDKRRVERLFRDEQIQTVYHAAAYKHVPIIEEQPDQGVDVNVFGTLTVLDAAIDSGADNFVLISTDKAVRPTNAMGASKRTAELVLQAKAEQSSHTCISMVRFGNVLGSSGSVVPKFKKQINAGGPITLTHAAITRFFMTIPEAAQLVLQASAVADGGDVFVLDMGEPVRIEDLAITMVRLMGKKLFRDTGNPDDIHIVEEGLRPGEKMYEELFITNTHQQTLVPKVFTAREGWLPWNELEVRLNEIRMLSSTQDRAQLRSALLDMAFATELPPPGGTAANDSSADSIDSLDDTASNVALPS